MRTLLRDRSFRLLWLGQTLSAFGDYAMFLAIGIWAKELTGSNAAAGLTILPFAIPALFGPALGIVADRFPRRRVMIATDLTAAAVECCLLFVHDRGDVWILYVVSFFLGVVVTIYQGARSGLLVGMLEEDALGDANGLLQSSNQAMRLAAPLAGAGLFAVVGGQAVALLDAGTFLVSAALLAAVRARDIERRTDELRIWHETKEGLRHIWATADLRRLTIGVSFVTLLIGMSEVAIYAVIDEGLHRPASFLGIISAVQGLGLIATGIVTGWLLRRLGAMRGSSIGADRRRCGARAVRPGDHATRVRGAIAGGVANTLFLVGYVTLMQTRTSLELQGRVMAAVESLATVPFLFSIAVGAALIARIDFRVIYAVEAAGIAAVGVAFWHWAGHEHVGSATAVDPVPEGAPAP